MKNLDNIKIIFIDIDRTLLNDKGHITMKTRKSIKRVVDKGIYVVLTSGRNCSFCVDKSKRALASNIVISSNGAEIYDYGNKKMLYSNFIDKSKLEEIWEFCNKKEIGIIFNTTNDRYINKYLIGNDKYKTKLITSFKELNKVNVSQFVIVSDDYNKIYESKKKIKSLDLDIAYFSKSFEDDIIVKKGSLDGINKNVSKGSGVSELLKILKLKKSNSLCFGDYLNDLDMFKACGYKVAMDNACQEIKDMADFVTLSNNKNGVAYFLDKYL